MSSYSIILDDPEADSVMSEEEMRKISKQWFEADFGLHKASVWKAVKQEFEI